MDECKNDIRKKKNSEAETIKCISACMGYSKLNVSAAFKVVVDNIEASENFLDKI